MHEIAVEKTLNMTNKFTYDKLKKFLVEEGKTFSEFLDSAGSPPSRRTWADGTHPDKGVTEVTSVRMRKSILKVGDAWGISFPEEAITATKVTGDQK